MCPECVDGNHPSYVANIGQRTCKHVRVLSKTLRARVCLACRLDAAAAAALSAALCSQLTHLGLKGAALMCEHKPCQQQQQQQSLSAAEHDAGHPAGLSPGCPAAQLFTAALAAHPSLTTVTLQAAALGCTGAPSCHASAAAGSSGSNTCTACWQSIGGYAAAAQRLQELVLSEAGLGDVGARQLGAGLTQAAAAGTEAWQAASGAEHTGVQLASGTTRASGIRLLDLSSNGLGAEGAAALGQGLGLSWAALKVLKLGSNQLGAEGVSRFVQGLLAATGTACAASSTLRQRGGAVTAAAGAGGGCMQLQELDLSGNGIAGESGWVTRALVVWGYHCSSLLAVHLGCVSLAHTHTAVCLLNLLTQLASSPLQACSQSK